MTQNYDRNGGDIPYQTRTSSSKHGSQSRVRNEPGYYEGRGNFFTEEGKAKRNVKSAHDYYNIYNSEKNYITNSSRENSLKKIYGNSSSKRSIRASSAHNRKGKQNHQERYHTADSMMSSTKRPQRRIEVESDYEYIQDYPEGDRTKSYTKTNINTAGGSVKSETCCGCVEVVDKRYDSCFGSCLCTNENQTETDIKQVPQYEQIHKKNDFYGNESYSDSWDDDDDSEYGDRHRLISERQRVEKERDVRQNNRYTRVVSRKPVYNPTKRHVGVQMNTKYIIHNERPVVRKPQVRNVSCQTVAPRPPSPEIMLNNKLPRPSTPSGPVVVFHVCKEPSPGVTPRLTVVSSLHKSSSSEVTPRLASPQSPKVVPFIGEPPNPNENYITAYFEYKVKKKKKKTKKPRNNDIIVKVIDPDPLVSVPIKEPPPEPEIVYYRDPTPEPVPSPTPSPPSTPPRLPLKIPKRKSKSVMTRVGGGWMKVEHHRNHHIPLTVYEHPRALDDKFLYIKSRYTPDKERVPIAYKKYREMVVRNGKVG